MDAGDLLREARRRAQLSQRLLARAAGASQSQVAGYESGAVSPTVATLDRLLSACGLQARVALEPLLAEVDARVDAMLARDPDLDTPDLDNLVCTLDDDPQAQYLGFGSAPYRQGPVTWAFDGHTALGLQRLAVTGRGTALAVVLDEAARWWLRGIGAQATNAKGWAVHWLEEAAEVLAEATRHGFFTMFGMLSLRIVDELPPTVDLAVAWCHRSVPVATVDAVERHWAEHAEVLARLRERRARDVA